jgi:manganese-dependent inorganic pyrophosphatase
MTYFICHKSPDTDGVCASIAAAKLFNGIPILPGEINKETAYVLNRFNVKAPEIETDFNNKKIYLIDYNQTTQHAPGAQKAEIVGIIDHHALKNATVVTDQPIPVLIRPWGSSCAIIGELFFKQNKTIDKTTAQLLIAGILSDTLAFTSPTTTDNDKNILEKLLTIAQITDYMPLAIEMFQAKSNITSLHNEKIVTLDYKEFIIGDYKLGINVLETVVPQELKEKTKELIPSMLKLKQENNLDYIYTAIIDILKTKCWLIIASDKEKEVAENVFNNQTKDNLLNLGNIVSRKKQIVPAFQSYLTK